MAYNNKIKILLLSFSLLSVVLSLTPTSGDNPNQIPISYQPDALSLHQAHIAEVQSNKTKTLFIDLKQIQQLVNSHNQAKIMNSFLLQCKSVVRMASLALDVRFISKDTVRSYNLSKDQNKGQSTIVQLYFLSQFKFSEISSIQVKLNSDNFSVVKLTLMNNFIADEINLVQLQKQNASLPPLSLWLPFSYNPQQQKYTQIIKYFYFKAGPNPTNLKITRLKGHPKIFMYNCQADKRAFCRQQIEQEHIEGTLMLQKEIQFEIVHQKNCRDCSVIVAVKNMGAQTSLEITQHTAHDTVVLSKDQPVYEDLTKNSSLEITSYFILDRQARQAFLDFQAIEGNAGSISVGEIKISQLFAYQRDQSQLIELSGNDFHKETKLNSIKVFLNPEIDLSKYKRAVDQNSENWYIATVRISSKDHTFLTVLDQNIPKDQQKFITLKDGQILHYTASSSQKISSKVQSFKVKVESVSTLTISANCQQFNQLQIQFYSSYSSVTHINPKVFVSDITNHNKKCSQLIHLNPSVLFDTSNSQATSSNWVYIKVQGVFKVIDLLFSSNDIIILEKSFPHHSQLQYNQALHLFIRNIKNQARIKIHKCSNCHVSLSYSEEQLADLKAKRHQPIINRQASNLTNTFQYKMTESNGLFIKVTTNNFAHFVIQVEEVQGQVQVSQQIVQYTRKIAFSLSEDNSLVLQFQPPTFLDKSDSPTYFSLVQGSISVQVARQTYCPEFIFSTKQKTRDISLTPITPQLTTDPHGNQHLTFTMELKHHDFFGIRAQKGNEIFGYEIVNIENMKEYAENRWSIFNVLLFITFALFMSFVCFMGLKRKKIKKIGGQIVQESDDGQTTSMTNIRQR